MIRTEEEHLAHYGILRRSGRYPWGSGGTESARNRTYLATIDKLKKDGMSEAEIARGFGITTTELRAARSIALAQQKQEKILTAQRLKEKGWSNVAIGDRMNLNESSVRALLAPGEKDKADALQTTANMLKDQVAAKKYIDIGSGVERHVGVTQTRLNTAVAVLKEQGYITANIKDKQLETGKYTTTRVLAAPGTKITDIERNRSQIRQIDETSQDHGRTFDSGFQTPISVSSRRIAVRYADEGGGDADGVIYVRPGSRDLSLGNNRYAQVRIAVDGTHYLKGMAIYKDDLPDGVDLVFNTSKANTGRKKDAMKPLEADPDLPFGSIVRQIKDPKGNVSSAMNLVNEQGSWDRWSKTLSTQVLSKQSPDLAKRQLDLTFERRLKDLDEIKSLVNPTVRKDLLLKFADEVDTAAVHLKAASLPRQVTRVILPITSMKDNEVYAPGMRNGETVALIRYPHGGKFEIPQLTVNNRNREARKTLGTEVNLDAIGIHPNVAKRLSGADFDGDTVLVIPNNNKRIQNQAALDGLKNFDPHVYKIPDDSPIPRLTEARKGFEMGQVSNLITDMTIHGANTEELARAVRHSMVVIDAAKHGLDYRQSEKDNGIRSLKEKYQGGKKAGASTLFSRASARTDVVERNPRSAKKGGPIDPETGRKVFEPTGRQIPVRRRVRGPDGKITYVDTGRFAPATQRSKKLAETDDAHTLVSDSKTKMENIYADHSNRLKAMANSARKDAVHTRGAPYSPSAKKVYSQEVASLDAKLNVALKNAPLERQAQRIAAATLAQKRQANPNLEPDDVKKIKRQALTEARIRTGAGKTRIVITPKEWEAVQAGAISTHKLNKIITNTDTDNLKRMAMPKTTPKLTGTMLTRANSMLASGYTQREVADALGIGLTTLKVGLNE